MTSAENSDASVDVRLAVKAINDAWLNRPIDKIAANLADLLADDVVFKGPDFADVARGRDACMAGYVEFASTALVLECELAEPSVDLFDESAVAAYRWKMRYELQGELYSESGHDIFIFARREGRWQAIWRWMLPSDTAV